jgi:hypothetical protein
MKMKEKRKKGNKTVISIVEKNCYFWAVLEAAHSRKNSNGPTGPAVCSKRKIKIKTRTTTGGWGSDGRLTLPLVGAERRRACAATLHPFPC